jgi:hypothetical protein
VVTLFLASLFALIGLLFMEGSHSGPRVALELYFLAALTFTSLSVALGGLKLRLPKRVKGLLESWDRYRRNPGLLYPIVLLGLLYYLLWSLSNWLALKAIGVTLGPLELFFYAGGQIHALLINLTPAGLGVMESFGVFAGQTLNFTPAEALLSQALFRLSAIVVLGLTGFWGWLHLLPKIRKKGAPDPPQGA